MAEYQPGKLATTEMRQPLILGSLRVTLVLDASGPERATAFVPTSTATAVAETARPFTTVSIVAEYRPVGRAAEEPLGACAGDSLGPDVGAPVGNGAGAVSDELGAAVSDELGADSFGATTGGVDAAGSSGRHEKVLVGQLERFRRFGLVQPQSRPRPATAPRSTTMSPRRQQRPGRSQCKSRAASRLLAP